MAEQAVIGNNFVFQVLFLDAEVEPFTPIALPRITLFSFSTSGVKNPLVVEAEMAPVQPVEVGRYVYVYTIPTSFFDGSTIYAEIRATDEEGTVYHISREVTLISATRSGTYHNAGLHARFV